MWHLTATDRRASRSLADPAARQRPVRRPDRSRPRIRVVDQPPSSLPYDDSGRRPTTQFTPRGFLRRRLLELLDEVTAYRLIAGSEDPADLEAYLAEFPNGSFQPVVEAKLTELTPAPADPENTENTDLASAAADPIPQSQKCQFPSSLGETCLVKIQDQDCYVWTESFRQHQSAVWSGGCGDDMIAEGEGELVWTWTDDEGAYGVTARGELQGGWPFGHWSLEHRGGRTLDAEYGVAGRLIRAWATAPR